MEDETQKEISPASELAPPNSGENLSISEEDNPIEKAKQVLEANQKLLDEMKKERARIEKATAEMLINGRSYAGQSQPKTETEDEKWAREAKIRYAGTGMDPTPKDGIK